jgi:hypothetical protein
VSMSLVGGKLIHGYRFVRRTAQAHARYHQGMVTGTGQFRRLTITIYIRSYKSPLAGGQLSSGPGIREPNHPRLARRPATVPVLPADAADN